MVLKQFKPGDWVICTENCENAFTKGKKYKIRYYFSQGEDNNLYPYDGTIMVELDDKGSKTNGWSANKFIKVLGRGVLPKWF